MKKSNTLALAAAALMLSVAVISPVGPLAVSQAQAQSVSVSFDLFFDELEPHGVWVRHPQYRYVFCPTGVDTKWQPYTNGRWLYLDDYGWYFDSDEPFGWATFHYGRWLDDDQLGWCWVPGTEWAPAWVSWRRSNDIVGWAPLPPEEEGFSLSLNVTTRDLPQTRWVYVPVRQFVEPNLSVSIMFGSQAADYYERTEFLGPVRVQGDVVVNNVLEISFIEQQINQEVTVYNVTETQDPAATTVQDEENSVQLFRAAVAAPEEETAPAEAVEEAQAVDAITAEGGTAGQTEGDAATSAASDAEVTDEPATEEPAADEPAADEPTVDGAASEGEEPAETTEEAVTAPEGAAAAPDTVEEGEPVCEADEMVEDGACVPLPTEKPAVDAAVEAETEVEATDDAAAEADVAAETTEAAPAAAEAAMTSETAEPAATETEPASAEAAADPEAGEPEQEVAPAEEGSAAGPVCAEGEILSPEGLCVPADPAE